MNALERYELSIKLITKAKLSGIDYWCMIPNRSVAHDGCACIGCIDSSFIKHGAYHITIINLQKTQSLIKKNHTKRELMSKNNKNSRRIQQAREWSKTRLSGGKGPKVNSSTAGKKSYRTEKDGRPREDRRKSMGDFVTNINARLDKRWAKTGTPATR